MRKQFQLPEEDVLFLESQALGWETLLDNNMNWVIIHDYPVSSGYNIEKTDIAIKIETGYPRAGLDMAYFYPPIIRNDGFPIRAICNQIIDGKQFQRWSRHRTPINPWREGVDDLSTHLSLVSYWFDEEFLKKANGITA